MMQMEEKTLQLWEQDPWQYRKEIEATEKRFSDEFLNDYNNGTRWYKRDDLTREERERYSQADHIFFTQWTRLTNLVTRIVRMQHKQDMLDHERWTRQYNAKQAKAQPQKRRIVMSNDPQVMVAAAEQYEMQLMMKRYLIIGEA